MKISNNPIFVSYDFAKRLKEIGFDEPCLMVYYGEGDTGQPQDKLYLPSAFGKIKNSDLITNESIGVFNKGHITAPLYQQVIDWLREVHGVHVLARYYTFGVESCNGWYYSFNDGRERVPSIFQKYNSFYTALNGGLDEAIRQLSIILKLKNNGLLS